MTPAAKPRRRVVVGSGYPKNEEMRASIRNEIDRALEQVRSQRSSEEQQQAEVAINNFTASLAEAAVCLDQFEIVEEPDTIELALAKK